MKTLKQVIEAKKAEVPTPSSPVEPDSVTSYVPKTKDEKRFMDKHVVVKTADANGNGDDHFRATNIDTYSRNTHHHGYARGQDQGVYEETGMKTLSQILSEKHLTPAELSKREDIAQAMERETPGMKKAKKMAIATAAAKRVAEEVETLEEGEVAHAQYLQYHCDTKKMLDKIGKGLDTHAKHVSNKNGYNGGQAHWGHVGDMKDFHRQVQDLHDRVLQQGEYAAPPQVAKLKEEVDFEVNPFDVFGDQGALAAEVFESLTPENRETFVQMMEQGLMEELTAIIVEAGAD
jgi:hypothetical protein